MEKEKLTLENFKEVALSLLKEENGGDMTIDLIWDQGASLDKEGIEKARKLMEEIGSTKIEDGVYEYLYDLNFLTLNEKKDELVETVMKKYCDYDEYSDEYEELQFGLREMVDDYFNIDLNEKEIIENTDIEELDIFLISNNETALEDEIDLINDFSSYKALQAGLEDVGSFQPIVFLIQSQGYEVEDLYDKEKVENSKFLKSLQTELEENLGDMKDGNVVFTKLNSSNLDEFSNIVDNIYNLKIPKEMLQVGIYDLVSEKGSNLEIELEKDIVLSKENYKVFTEYSSGDKFEINHFFEDYESKKDETKFEISLDKSFKMHEVDLDKIKETIDKNYNFDINEIKKDYEREF